MSLDDARVSLRHAYLQVMAGRLWWVDLDSRRGTHGRQGRQAAGVLDGSQPLRIYPFHIRLLGGCLLDEAEPASLSSPLSSASYTRLALPRVRLDFLEGTAKPLAWTMDRSLTLVGGASCCTVRLHSPLISRVHCALLHTAAGLWLIDLLGREGVQVNGTAVRWALLEDADELRIGQFRIRIDCPRAPEPAAPSVFPPPSIVTNGPTPTTAIVPSPVALEPVPSALDCLFSSVFPLAPASSTAVAAPEGGNESLLVPFITQISLMQQQMFEQFQQALTMMAHLFRDLHREQMQLIREEMDQLREVTRELQSVQAELARHTLAPSPDAAPAPAPTPAAPAVPTAPPAEALSLPATLQSLPLCSSPPGEPASSLPSPPPVQSNGDVHAWLSQRLLTLQQERQSRWQKILNIVTGKKVEQAVP